MKKSIALVLCCLFGLCLSWWYTANQAADRSGPEQSPSGIPQAGQAGHTDLRGKIEGAAVRSTGTTVSVISGMAYVRDRPQGQRRTLTEGYLLFENGLQVEVLKGAWSVTDSGGTSHRIVGMFENGRELRFMEVEVASLDEEIVLESYSYPGFFLNATTSDSKLISGYSVLQERDLHRGPRGEHPGSVSSCLMVVSRATGWSYLPETEASDGRYWVTAPGKTWGRIDEKEVSGDGAVTVVLEPADRKSVV